jgi:hypothetical protein
MRRENHFPPPLPSVTPTVMPVTVGPSRVKPFGPLRALDRPALLPAKKACGRRTWNAPQGAQSMEYTYKRKA